MLCHKQYQEKDKTYYAHTRIELLRFVPKNIKQALDIGCGVGAFGEKLKENFDCTVWGIEPHEVSALEAQGKIDNVLITRFDEYIDLKKQKFDCIFFNDVLEHLIDPYHSLELCKKFLLPNGYIISSIPNVLHFNVIYELLLTRDWKYEDAGVLDRTHLRFFTKKSIVRMFETCGFKVLLTQGINPCYGKKFKVLNTLLLNQIEEMKYIQYATVAQF